MVEEEDIDENIFFRGVYKTQIENMEKELNTIYDIKQTNYFKNGSKLIRWYREY
jgi:hypothetical protein